MSDEVKKEEVVAEPEKKKKNGVMGTIGNILWVIFGGLEWCIGLFIAGIIECVTIIGIPVGLQMFKLAKFVLWPFGKKVVETNITGFKKFVNFLWMISGGWTTALGFALTGVFFCITIIGIPFGKQYFKMAKFILKPLGHDFE